MCDGVGDGVGSSLNLISGKACAIGGDIIILITIMNNEYLLSKV